MAYTEKINNRIKELNEIKTEIITVINNVQSSTLRTLLIERYINYKTWEQNEEILGYSYVHIVHRLHPKALAIMKSVVEI